MYVIIGCIEDALTLLAIGMLFIPISFMFMQLVNTGAYTSLFGAALINGIVATSMIGMAMFLIPLFALTKIFYISRLANGGNKHE
jgi:hypothetical protein